MRKKDCTVREKSELESIFGVWSPFVWSIKDFDGVNISNSFGTDENGSFTNTGEKTSLLFESKVIKGRKRE